MGEYVTETNGGVTIIKWVSPPVDRIYAWGDADLPPQYWWVYPGAFKDRFANDYAAIAASDHPVCKAFISLLTDRLYVDLKGAVSQLFDALIAANQPETSPYIPGSSPMTAEKKAAILSSPTTDHERYVKGLAQPVEA